ncbi:MAG: permease-like cell division protein FtsX [Patescibacteria group bacterium]|nr:permease-like cell division protein FtsX [Patescibacteria group bacterium]
MFVNKSKRLVISALRDLSRNLWLNMATIIITVISLFTITTMLAIDAVGSHALVALQEKIDISIQFKDDADEAKILDLKGDLEKIEEVKGVEYISKDQALINFKETHKDNEYVNESIDELGENPLFAVLNVKANDITKYNSINEYIINNDNYKDIIEKVNFKENERAIENLSNILATIKDGIFGLTILFVFISVLVAFNTIRLAMYSHKIEIEIMQLVGASRWYIRMPFIIEGAILGVVGAVITLAIISPAAVYISSRITQFLPGFDLYMYFMDNFLSVSVLLILIGVFMGVFSSFIAIRRYLNV